MVCLVTAVCHIW